uniref:ZP domain-containing protein n=1 Tax=Glossina brevipalpis TaxID=37001 RepID=A0A1A9X5H8_9MUSC
MLNFIIFVFLIILSNYYIFGGHYLVKPDLNFFQTYYGQLKPTTFYGTAASLTPSDSDSNEAQTAEIADNRRDKDIKRLIPLYQSYLPIGRQSSNQINGFKQGFNASKVIEKSDPIKVIGPSDISSSQGYNYQIPEHFKASVNTQSSTDISSGDMRTLTKPINIDSPDLDELHCLSSQDKSGFFRVVIRINRFLRIFPVVDNDSIEKSCQFVLKNTYFILDMKEQYFQQCGVYQCGKDLCLRLRFPSIKSMRTASDYIFTVHCEIQKTVAVKTHTLKMGINSEQQGRSMGIYARGGKQNNLRTHIELLRKLSEDYTQHLNSERIVQLGEDLLLRAHVLPGDGWNYAKLTDIIFQRISPDGNVLQEVVLITSEGCLNPIMLSVCQGIIFEGPLAYKLPFKAFMFQGMSSGDELIMSIRITGCLYSKDCSINSIECGYADNSSLERHIRSVEMIENSLSNASETFEISKIPFRVSVTVDERLNLSYVQALKIRFTFLLAFLTFITILIGIVTFFKFKLNK